MLRHVEIVSGTQGNLWLDAYGRSNFEIVRQGEIVDGPVGCPGPWMQLADGGFQLVGKPLRVVWRRAWYLELSKHGCAGRRDRPLDGPFERSEEAMSAAGDFIEERRPAPPVREFDWTLPIGNYAEAA